MRLNCWEFKKCGREPGGAQSAAMGVCPAATFKAADGFLGGRNGGRACTYVTGTFCSGTVQGTYREKSKNCDECDFYEKVRQEEGAACSIFSFVAYIRERDREAHERFTRENVGVAGGWTRR